MKNWEEYKTALTYKGRWVHNWFSNMILVDILIDGEIYKSVENYYQSQKMTNEKDRLYIMSLTPEQSKTKAKKLVIRSDWQSYKFIVMKIALIEKFNIEKWKQKLLETNNDKIIEWNNWNDKEWGVSIKDCVGHNHLGMMLMEIREFHKYKSLF